MKKFSFSMSLILVIAGAVYAYFQFNGNEEKNSKQSPDIEDEQVEKEFEPGNEESDANEVTFSLRDNGEKNGKRTMEYVVKNEEDKEIELEFGTSMKYDFFIIDKDGNEVYRESEDKNYMQVVQDSNLDPNEKETFKLELPKLDPGELYTYRCFCCRRI